jgi:putative transcriptional regulator
MQNINLTGQFLIAMPGMIDPYFSKTVSYICMHNQDGAFGIILNRPIDMDLAKLFGEISLEIHVPELAVQPVMFGGPVQRERGFVLHSPHGDYNSTIEINAGISLTTSKDILESISDQNPPEKLLIALGYAGWTYGQIENEISQNAWLNWASPDTATAQRLIFDVPYADKFDWVMSQMGLNLANLSETAGHA